MEIRDNVIAKVAIVAIIIIALVSIGMTVYVTATYGNLPIAEVPAWAVPFMFGYTK